MQQSQHLELTLSEHATNASHPEAEGSIGETARHAATTTATTATTATATTTTTPTPSTTKQQHQQHHAFTHAHARTHTHYHPFPSHLRPPLPRHLCKASTKIELCVCFLFFLHPTLLCTVPENAKDQKT